MPLAGCSASTLKTIYPGGDGNHKCSVLRNTSGDRSSGGTCLPFPIFPVQNEYFVSLLIQFASLPSTLGMKSRFLITRLSYEDKNTFLVTFMSHPYYAYFST